MAKLKKYIQKQNLRAVRTLIKDTTPNSSYFQIRELRDVFHGGKNAFLIEGSELLNPGTEVLVEILDSNGDPIFHQPIPDYAEGKARVISVEIYADTPPGPAEITVLGEAYYNENGDDIPDQWKGVYNVKWQKRVTIDPLRVNDTKIRLYKNPTLEVTEILAPFRKPLSLPETKEVGPGDFDPTWFNPSYMGFYVDSATSGTANPLLKAAGAATLSTDYVDGEVRVFYDQSTWQFYNNNDETVGSASFTASIVSVLNETNAYVTDLRGVEAIISGAEAGTFQVASMPQDRYVRSSDFSISFAETPGFLETTLTRSFADTVVNNLTTFSGDVARARYFVKSIDSQGDFELVFDTLLESAILTNTASANFGPVTDMGDILHPGIVELFWAPGRITGSRALVREDGQTGTGAYVASRNVSALINSVHFTSPDFGPASSSSLEEPQAYLALPSTGSMTFLDELEYTFEGNLLCLKDTDDYTARIDVYVSGTAFPSSDPFGTRLARYEVESGSLRRLFTDQEVNFIPSADGEGQLMFVIWGGDWYLSETRIKSSFETGFNPDVVEFLIPITGKRFETLQFKVELFDPNNNYLPIEILSDNVYFDGGNLLLRGRDHRIEGSLTVAPSGSGVTITSAGFLKEDGSFDSGSAIYMGEGRVFHSGTAFLVAESTDHYPDISISDRLHGYIDRTTGEFILIIVGTILVGSGSSQTDIRSLLPRNPSDQFFHRLRGIDLDFYDIMGRKAVTAGDIDSTNTSLFQDARQIARMGKYTRGSSPRTVPGSSPLVITGTTGSLSPFSATTVTSAVSASGTIDIPSDVMIWNNTLYGNIAVNVEELILVEQEGAYETTFELTVDTSWVGFESGSSPGTDPYVLDLDGTRVVQTLALESDFWITKAGSYSPDPYISYPIHIPQDRPDGYNTLYVVVKLAVTVKSTSV